MQKEIIQKCPICGNNSMVLAVGPTINSYEADKVELRCCDSCGHWWHSPVPNQVELNQMYNSASSFVVSSGAKESYQNKNALDSFHKYVLKRINRKSGNYLEIGAGGGSLLRRFRSMNYNCYGVDPGQWVKDSSIVYSMDDLPSDLKFDVIILQDVLEHVLDPVGLMKELKKKTRNDSVFFCSFPCNDSRPARVYKSKWTMVRPYGHLHYFSFASAMKMFAFVDLSVKDIRLERVKPISAMFLRLDFRGLLYEILKGSKDQIYTQVFVQ
jgi:2-polyprenyl-3-methyl-5-hydroxy-6-metoxy-1,4-benzoquinol methylase